MCTPRYQCELALEQRSDQIHQIRWKPVNNIILQLILTWTVMFLYSQQEKCSCVSSELWEEGLGGAGHCQQRERRWCLWGKVGGDVPWSAVVFWSPLTSNNGKWESSAVTPVIVLFTCVLRSVLRWGSDTFVHFISFICWALIQHLTCVFRDSSDKTMSRVSKQNLIQHVRQMSSQETFLNEVFLFRAETLSSSSISGTQNFTYLSSGYFSLETSQRIREKLK